MIEILKLISFLSRISRCINFSRLTIALAILTALLSGIGYTSMIVVISRALARPSDQELLFLFLVLCIIVPSLRFASQSFFNWIGPKAVLELRLTLCRQILSAPLRSLEELGPHRLLASLTDDIASITAALVMVPALSTQVAIIVGCLVYIGWLSPLLLLVILGFMTVGVVSYNIPLLRARSYFSRLREETDSIFSRFQGLIYGTKELKLHRRRRALFISSALTPTGEAIRDLTFRGNTALTVAAIWGNLLFFITFGILIFGFGGARGTGLQIIAGCTFGLLYMMAPLEAMFQVLPTLSRAATAVVKIEKLGLDLEAQPKEAHVPSASGLESRSEWHRLDLIGIRYAYRTKEQGDAFAIGPLSLTFKPGELIFLIGGNGSGKTTLAKIVTGLYLPDEGEIRLDGQPVIDENRDNYRELFSTVFSDFYLFDRLIGKEGADLDSAARDYLVRLQLDDMVKVENGVLSTINLSQGQRKRLALLAAYLEDRPIYFFDEWAADQDPQYKAIFYFELLPELKARGKTVFVISHDDRYYSLADRLIKFNYGQIEWDRNIVEFRSASESASAS